MIRVIACIIVIALTIYCTIDVAQSRAYQVRLMPKWLWAVVVIFLPVIGSISWLLWGRGLPPSKRSEPMKAPDDDPDFLASL